MLKLLVVVIAAAPIVPKPDMKAKRITGVFRPFRRLFVAATRIARAYPDERAGQGMLLTSSFQEAGFDFAHDDHPHWCCGPPRTRPRHRRAFLRYGQPLGSPRR
ncbi:hypothetical protein [Amycolatopsis ultiminotia]|uniref:hypothetical protein n=1 Tax=Amycolatopsis ultiminotia TaxID=543629 RepID=UPI0031E68584